VAAAAARRGSKPQATGRILDGCRGLWTCNLEMWFTELPEFDDRIRAAHALGFRAIEFWPWRGKDLQAIAATCRELDVQVGQFTAWGFVPGLNDPANHARFAQEIEASCEVAGRLGAPCLTVVAGNDVPGLAREEMHANVVTGLKLAAPIAEKHRVTLILEPMNGRVDHPGHCLYGSEAGVAIARAVGSERVRVLFDLYHNAIAEGDLCGHLREGRDQLAYVQVADHPGRTEPGTGEIHYPRVLKELWDLGYESFLGTECRPRDSAELAAERIAAADRAAREWS
jgi:hydroxypyruvate isomerase